jgi:hypothetical protein
VASPCAAGPRPCDGHVGLGGCLGSGHAAVLISAFNIGAQDGQCRWAHRPPAAGDASAVAMHRLKFVTPEQSASDHWCFARDTYDLMCFQISVDFAILCCPRVEQGTRSHSGTCKSGIAQSSYSVRCSSCVHDSWCQVSIKQCGAIAPCTVRYIRSMLFNDMHVLDQQFSTNQPRTHT